MSYPTVIDAEEGSKSYKEITHSDFLKIENRTQLEVFYSSRFPSYVVIKEIEKNHILFYWLYLF